MKLTHHTSALTFCLLLGLLGACQKNTNTTTTEPATAPAATAPASPAQSSFRGTEITGVDWGKDFSLSDSQGATRHLHDFLGQVVVVFFGYTSCPDICPTTLAALRDAVHSLGNQASKVQVLFITLDPERDTAKVLASYTKTFDPSFIALRGDLEQTKQVAANYKVFFTKSYPQHDKSSSRSTQPRDALPYTAPPVNATTRSTLCDWLPCAAAHGSKDSHGQYGIDHTALTYVYDPQGRLRLAWSQSTSAPDMATDLKLLLDGK